MDYLGLLCIELGAERSLSAFLFTKLSFVYFLL